MFERAHQLHEKRCMPVRLQKQSSEVLYIVNAGVPGVSDLLL